MNTSYKDLKDYYLSNLHEYHQITPQNKYSLFKGLQPFLCETEEEILFPPEIMMDIIRFLAENFTGISYLGSLLEITHSRSARNREIVQCEIFQAIVDNKLFLNNYRSHILFTETFQTLRKYLEGKGLIGSYYFNLLYPGKKDQDFDVDSKYSRIDAH